MPTLRKLLMVLTALALSAAACGGSSSDAATADTDSGAGTGADASATPPGDAGSESDGDSTGTDSAGGGSDEIVEEESTDVFDIGLGDCFNDQALAGAGDDSAEITDVGSIPCDLQHQFEVYHTFDMLNDTFPGESETVDISETGCFDAFEPFVGLDYADSIYGLSYLYPTDLSWKQGDREVLCVISMYDGSAKTGSARGTAQ